MQKPLPFARDSILALLQTYPTPFHLYDERSIRANAQRLQAAFAWAPAFTEYFAVKATPNPYILTILGAEGCGVDCSSLAELVLAERSGFAGEGIMFTSNDTPAEDFRRARASGAIINLDDLSHLPYLEQQAGLPELLCFRYNPGALRTGNAIIGAPQEAKYGLTRDQLFAAYRQAHDKGVRRFGLHTMVASNELNAQYFIDTAAMLFDLVVDLARELDIRVEFVNLGGGIGIPYRPDQPAVDLAAVGAGIRAAYERRIAAHGCHPLKIAMECGRLITGPAGVLVTRVRHVKQTYKAFAGLDASMADLMRPGMYGAYHHITVLGKEDQPADRVYDVTGSLCENNDKFAVDRPLPALDPGDVLVIHDTGAHGHAMGFNYNGKLRSAEILLRANGEALRIRRAETLDDYFATLDFAGLGAFASSIYSP
jgi:diaminopimelate decarboxylase